MLITICFRLFPSIPFLSAHGSEFGECRKYENKCGRTSLSSLHTHLHPHLLAQFITTNKTIHAQSIIFNFCRDVARTVFIKMATAAMISISASLPLSVISNQKYCFTPTIERFLQAEPLKLIFKSIS